MALHPLIPAILGLLVGGAGGVFVWWKSRQAIRALAEKADLAEILPVALWLRNAQGRITYANAAYRNIAGIDDEAEGELAELAPAAKAMFLKVKQYEKTQREAHHLVVQGQRRLYEIMKSPLSGGGAVGLAFDNTAHEELDQERKDLEQALREVMENSASAMAFFDSSRQISRYNQAYLQLWGFDEAHLRSKPRYDELLEMLRERRRLPEQANFAAFRKQQMEYFTNLTEPVQEFFYLPEGTSLRVVVIPYASGGLIFIYDNITDRLALEQSFNQSIAVQKATMDHLFEGVAVFGEDGRLKFSNPRFAEIWQLDWDFIEEQPKFSELLESTEYLYDVRGDWPNFLRDMLMLMNTRKRNTRKLELIDGKVVQWSLTPLPDGATLMTYLDISDSERMERSLRERNQVLEEAGTIKTKFLANVSYELRSPLTSIKGFSEFLIEGVVGPLNEKQLEYLRDIYRSTIDLSAMIDDILDVASLEAGYVTLDVAEFDLYMMLSSIFPFVQEKLNRRDIFLNFQCSPLIGKMIGDERRLRHAILQLLDNMMKFCARGSDILFKVWSEEDDIVILLQDVTSLAANALIAQETPSVTSSQSSISTVVATDTLDAIGSPVIRSLVGLHGGTVEINYAGEQRCRVVVRIKRRHGALNAASENVQFSSAL